jgi:class 3 adenylate cyclase/GAF domain-containing protein
MRGLYQWLNRRFLRNRTLHSKLTVVFGLFFFVPVTALIYFGIHYDILTDRYLPLFFVVLLSFSLLGLGLLRNVFNDITRFTTHLALRVKTDFGESRESGDELQQLEASFSLFDRRLSDTEGRLRRKSEDLRALRGLVDLCYVTADPNEILHVALERALEMTGSDVGAILLLDGSNRRDFVVRATIGLDQRVKIHDRIDFESSIAKYAVLNKTALVVEDVEKDTRFGRTNRPHYDTKSFVCLPIKTSRDIIGVMTISCRACEKVYHTDDIEAVEPLLSNAAFSYENLILNRDYLNAQSYLAAIVTMLDIINSSFRGTEMLQACLQELRSIVPLELALILKPDPHRAGDVMLFDLLAFKPARLMPGDHFPAPEGSVLGKMLHQQSTLILENDSLLRDENGLHLSDARMAAILVSLKLEGGTNGVLVLAAGDSEPLQQHQIFIERAARCLALALERNCLHQIVIKRNRELDSIKQIGSALASSTFDLNQVLNYTMDMIRVIMNVEAGALYMVSDKELDFAVAFNIDPSRRKPVRLKLGQGIPGYVAARGEPLVVNESHGAALFMPELNADKEMLIQSALCVPMVSQGKVIGVIEVLNKNNGDFGPGDQDLLQSIASSVSIAVENANLYKETVAMAENERGIRRIFQKFVPKEVLDKILHGSGIEMVEELKTLTLINIDIRGFSGLVKTLGPQKTVSLLNAFFSLMGGIVFKHNGIVDKYLGDGFLAIFGAPVSSVADADNAVAAALEMQAALNIINNGLARQMGVCLNIGISIHTGEVVVGNIGFEMKMDYTVIGDSVNDVFRLQDLVRPFPNSIFISQSTLKASRFPLHSIELDERLGRMKVYKLLGPNNSGLEDHAAIQGQSGSAAPSRSLEL